MLKFLKKVRRNEEGATAIEYGLIAALIAIALITALQSVGGSLTARFNSIASAVSGAGASNAGGGGSTP